jgi:Mrp family chromosome partitioning ATPase
LKLVLAGRDSTGYANPVEERLSKLLERLSKIADVVVVDTPPLPEVAEVLDMASAVEVVIVAVRLGRTRRDKLGELRDLLASRGISPAGFVVTTRDRVERETEYDYPGEVAKRPARIETGFEAPSRKPPAVARRRRV